MAGFTDTPRATLACSLQLVGHRGPPPRPSGVRTRWFVDDAVLRHAFDTAILWVADGLAEDVPLMVSFGDTPAPAASVADAHDRIHEATHIGLTRLWWQTHERFRAARFDGWHGAIGFGEGGRELESGSWQPGVERLTEQLVALAPWVAQGRIVRSAVPDMDGVRAFVGPFKAAPEELVHGVHGVQLINDGLAVAFAGRPEWEVRPLGHGRSLVRALDAAAWFVEARPGDEDDESFAAVLPSWGFEDTLPDRTEPPEGVPSPPPRRVLGREHRRLQGEPHWSLEPPEPEPPARPRPIPHKELKVAPAVDREWRKRRDTSSNFTLSLLLRSSRPAAETAPALRAAIRRARHEFEEGPDFPEGYEEPSLGSWSVDLLPEGAFLAVGDKPERFEEMFEFVVAALREDGVTGALELYVPPGPPPLPRRFDLVECQLRIRDGAEEGRVPADRDALRRRFEAALEWCLADADDAITSVSTGFGGQFAVSVSAILAAVRPRADGSLPQWIVRVHCLHADRVRVLSLDATYGRVSMIEGGPALVWGAWEPIVDRFRDLLVAGADDLAYALLKRGSDFGQAENGTSLDHDWPARDGAVHTSKLHRRVATHVPDAFGLQLLGPGHLDRAPDGPAWRRTAVGRDHVLLEAAEPERFFAQRTMPFGGHARTDVPDFLATARADFAPLLAVKPPKAR